MSKKMILFLLSGMLCLIISGCGGGSGGGPGSGSSGSTNLSGKVWRDQNQNQIVDDGETGIPSIKVNLYRDSNGNNTLESTDELASTTNADWDGNYSFNVTATGTYFISVDTQSGINALVLTTENADTIVTGPSFVALRINVTSLSANIGGLSFGFTNRTKWKLGISPNSEGSPFGSPFVSSPAIAPDGTLYIGSGNHYLYTINPDGTLRWKYETGGAISASPAIGSDGTVYAGSYDRQLYALRPADGSLKWVFPTKSVLSSSPAIGSDGTIYTGGTQLDRVVYGCGPTVTISHLYAVNPDGSKKWDFILSGVVLSSPAIGSDGTIYIASEGDILFDRTVLCDESSDFPPSDANPNFPVNGHLYAINPDGTLKWEFRALGPIDSSPAIGADGTIYVGSDGIKYEYGKTRHDFVTLNPQTQGFLYAINPNGKIKWYTDLLGDVKSSPAIGTDGTIYVGSDKNDFFALNPSGTIKWQYPTRGDVRSSPAIVADGTIYVGSNDGSLYAINPDGTVKTRFAIGGKVNSSPSIGLAGTIYFATGGGDDKLYSMIGNSALAETPWPKFRRDLPNTGRK